MQKISEKPVKIFSGIKPSEDVKIASLCNKLGVDLVDVAQDSAVQLGLVDMLGLYKIPAVGPKRLAGRLELDKVHSRFF